MTDFETKTGRTITEQDADRIANEAEAGYDLSKAKRVGRPSLTGAAGSSPRVNFRVPTELYDQAVERAEREGKGVSEIARDALEAYLAEV